MKVAVILKDHEPLCLNKFSIDKEFEYLRKHYSSTFNNEHFIIVSTEYQTIYFTVTDSGVIGSVYILNFYPDIANIDEYNFEQFIEYLHIYYLHLYIYCNANTSIKTLKLYKLFPNNVKFNKTQNSILQFKCSIDFKLNVTLSHEFPFLNKYEDIFGFLKKQSSKLHNTMNEFEKFISVVESDVRSVTDILGDFTELEYTSSNNCKSLKSTCQLINTTITQDNRLIDEKIKDLINTLRKFKINSKNEETVDITLVPGLSFIVAGPGSFRSVLTNHPYSNQFLYIFNEHIPFTDHNAEKIFSRFLTNETYYEAIGRVEFYKLKHT